MTSFAIRERGSYRWWLRRFHGEVSWRNTWPLRLSLDLGGEDRSVAVTFTIWRLFLHLSVQRVTGGWIVRRYGYKTDEIEVFRVSISPYTFQWALWLDGMQSSMPGTWKRPPKWRYLYVDLPSLIFGRNRYQKVDLGEPVPVVIPLPEGGYDATAQRTRQTWWRPRWPWWPLRKTSESVWLEIPRGLPHSGKGENSWDCGDDGIFGIGHVGLSIPAAIGNAVTATLKARERYGKASLVVPDYPARKDRV